MLPVCSTWVSSRLCAPHCVQLLWKPCPAGSRRGRALLPLPEWGARGAQGRKDRLVWDERAQKAKGPYVPSRCAVPASSPPPCPRVPSLRHAVPACHLRIPSQSPHVPSSSARIPASRPRVPTSPRPHVLPGAGHLHGRALLSPRPADSPHRSTTDCPRARRR